MTLEELLAKARADAAELRTKALTKAAEFTEEDAENAEKIAKDIGSLEKRIAAKNAASAALGPIGDSTPGNTSTTNDDPANAVKSYATAGESFVKSAAYAAFKKEYPNGPSDEDLFRFKASTGGSVVRKASVINTEGQGNVVPVRTGEVDDMVYRPETGFLDLITTGNTGIDYWQYRQIISKTNNASIVPEAITDDGVGIAGGVKPLSTLTTTTATARGHLYADGMEVTNKELRDDGIMSTLIDNTLRENLRLEVERVVLHGAGTDDEPAGLYNTPGVLQQAFAVDAPTSIRKAITKLRITSGAPISAVLLNPEDDEAWDLMKDVDGRYIGAGPFQAGITTAWGQRRIGTLAVPKGQAVIGDFKTIHLLQYAALQVQAFAQHSDFARRNLTYIRAEEEFVQLVRNAARLCIVDLTAG